mmetsp:Transcript_1226/g.2481  ORF Transcript_1226/g.2481 Transcript_1226/m.2481 type:complete len:435 (-) Transcript_1226:206-1510(-)
MVCTTEVAFPKNTKFYGVQNGRFVKKCVFFSWRECKKQIHGCDDAVYSTFDDLISAAKFALSVGDGPDIIALSDTENDESVQVSSGLVEDVAVATEKIMHDTTAKQASSSTKSMQSCEASADEETLHRTISTGDNVAAVGNLETSSSETNQLDQPSDKHQKNNDGGDEKPKQVRKPRDVEWEKGFRKLVSFKEEHGHLQVPKGYLRAWSYRQRLEFKKLKAGNPSKMTFQRIQRLTDIGFQFKVLEKKNVTWEERLEQLREFKRVHGHLQVPHLDPVLGNFITNTRTNYKQFNERGGKTYDGLSQERINQLNDLGFVFQVGCYKKFNNKQKSFEEHFEELKKFKQKYGHTKVPWKWAENLQLANFVERQRKCYKILQKGKLPHKNAMKPERALQLFEIGFVFDNTKGRGSKVVLKEIEKETVEDMSPDKIDDCS